jgi:hypothetical protein
MTLLLCAKSRAYPQAAPGWNPEAQEARSKENTNLKKREGRKGRKFYWLVFRPVSVVWFFTVENGMLLLRR